MNSIGSFVTTQLEIIQKFVRSSQLTAITVRLPVTTAKVLRKQLGRMDANVPYFSTILNLNL